MSYTDRQVEFDLESRLKDVHLTPGERADALAAAEKAEILVTTVQRIAAAFKRLTETTALKPSVRA
jgi:hypothetical protein